MAVSQWNFSKGYGTHHGNLCPFIPLTFCPFIDNTTPIGPCLVAAHVVPDPQKIPLKTTVNGKVVQDGTTASVSSSLPSDGTLTPLIETRSDQIFNVRQTIAFLSQGTTLLPGSIIMTGTPKGVGFVKKPPQYLKDGDDMTVWIGNGIGTLVNPVVEERGNEKAKL